LTSDHIFQVLFQLTYMIYMTKVPLYDNGKVCHILQGGILDGE